MSLALPDMDHEHIYQLSRERFRSEPFKQRLSNGQADVLALGAEYVVNGKAGTIHAIKQNTGVPPWIIAGDMQSLYKDGLLRKHSEARRYYEKLKLSSPSQVCPFCLHRTVKTVDHYLPKDKFAAYAVLPANLIPSCRDCNSEKSEFAAVDQATSLLHPYFDNVDSDLWLGCELQKSAGFCTPTFFINSAATTPALVQRLTSHMETLDLFDLYDVEGARELNDMTGALKDTFEASGMIGVGALCKSIGNSRELLARNYWRATLWRAAADDAAFCSLDWLL